MRVTKALREGRRPTKRLDLTVLRDLLRDRRVWAALGVVVEPDVEQGASVTHYEAVIEDGVVVDILVEVALAPNNVPVTCRLGGFDGQAGVIVIPDVGTEVVVNLPDGQLDFMPTIVAALPRPPSLLTQATWGDADLAPAPGRVVVCTGQLVVHDGTGPVDGLVTRTEFLDHTHPAPQLVGDTTYGANDDPTARTGLPDEIDGTQVLKSK